MKSTKIVELFIDDENDIEQGGGIEAISLVSRPAHEQPWMAFNSEKEEEKPEVLNEFKIVDEDFCTHNPQLDELGEDYSKLIKEGWEIVRVERITPQMVHKMNQQKFSSPNDPSELDTDTQRIRYKYVGPRDEKNRRFCREMLQKNRVYRIEDIEQLTAEQANEEFGFYSIFLWRGSFNCRHVWVRLIYKQADQMGNIRNSGNSTKGLEREEGLGPLQPDTRTTTTRNAENKSNQWKPGVPREGTSYVDTFSEFEEKGLEGACWEGYEAIGTKIVDGREVPNCVPIKNSEMFQETINDYPEGVKNAAKKAVAYAEKNGWGSCGTNVGKVRASQLSKGENISIDTVKRMYSYLSRHKADLSASKSYDDGCGKLMYDAWGGEAALSWAEKKLKQIEKEKMTFAIVDQDKKILIGAAMVPNRMIHRYDNEGNLYYVFFSKASIKKMADKFLKQKRTDETSIEHNGIKLGSDKVYVTESWVSDDPIYDKSYKYGFELPAGTWFVAMKINDDKIWKLIKDKSLTGFSVEGMFAEKKVFSKENNK